MFNFDLVQSIPWFIAGAAAVQLLLTIDTKREQRKKACMDLSHQLTEMGLGGYISNILGQVALSNWSGVYESIMSAIDTFSKPVQRKAYLLEIAENLMQNPEVVETVKANPVIRKALGLPPLPPPG